MRRYVLTGVGALHKGGMPAINSEMATSSPIDLSIRSYGDGGGGGYRGGGGRGGGRGGGYAFDKDGNLGRGDGGGGGGGYRGGGGGRGGGGFRGGGGGGGFRGGGGGRGGGGRGGFRGGASLSGVDSRGRVGVGRMDIDESGAGGISRAVTVTDTHRLIGMILGRWPLTQDKKINFEVPVHNMCDKLHFRVQEDLTKTANGLRAFCKKQPYFFGAKRIQGISTVYLKDIALDVVHARVRVEKQKEEEKAKEEERNTAREFWKKHVSSDTHGIASLLEETEKEEGEVPAGGIESPWFNKPQQSSSFHPGGRDTFRASQEAVAEPEPEAAPVTPPTPPQPVVKVARRTAAAATPPTPAPEPPVAKPAKVVPVAKPAPVVEEPEPVVEPEPEPEPEPEVQAVAPPSTFNIGDVETWGEPGSSGAWCATVDTIKESLQSAGLAANSSSYRRIVHAWEHYNPDVSKMMITTNLKTSGLAAKGGKARASIGSLVDDVKKAKVAPAAASKDKKKKKGKLSLDLDLDF